LKQSTPLKKESKDFDVPINEKKLKDAIKFALIKSDYNPERVDMEALVRQ
jgi:hypothetical protein